jgi:hypothetical protein
VLKVKRLCKESKGMNLAFPVLKKLKGKGQVRVKRVPAPFENNIFIVALFFARVLHGRWFFLRD